MDLLSDVFEEPKFALRRVRIGAALIDLSIIALVGYIIGIFFGQAYTTEGIVGYHLEGWPALLWFGAVFALIPLQEGLPGKTLGQRLVKIKVVRAHTLEVSVGASIVRHLFDIIDYFMLVGLILSCCNKKKQRIGDLVAGTS